MSLFFLVVLFFCCFFGFLFFGRFGFLVLCIFWFFSPFPFPFAADWHRPTDMQQTNNCFSSKILQICARWWCPVLFIYVCIYLFVIYCISDEFIELALFQTKMQARETPIEDIEMVSQRESGPNVHKSETHASHQ